jgi:hypothetical protein
VPEALARSHNDSILSRPARGASRKDKRGFAQTVARRLLSRPARTVAGATLAAILTGIVINALVMQKEHRSAPLFGAARLATEVSPPPAALAPATVQTAPVATQPPARPAGLGAASDPAPIPPSRVDDPIRDLLRGDAGKDPAHLVTAAQNALIKLGFAIKADGVIGASTEQAIQQFERAHGLAPSAEITPRLVKLLSAAANAAAH